MLRCLVEPRVNISRDLPACCLGGCIDDWSEGFRSKVGPGGSDGDSFIAKKVIRDCKEGVTAQDRIGGLQVTISMSKVESISQHATTCVHWGESRRQGWRCILRQGHRWSWNWLWSTKLAKHI